MLGGFEKYLIEQGFKVMSHDRKNGWQEVSPERYDKLYYSSMGKLKYRFVRGKTRIEFGLEEFRHPPYLLFPSPPRARAADIDRIFEDHSYEEILGFCENNFKDFKL